MDKMYGGVGFIGKSTEVRPTKNVKNGEELYLVDTGETLVWYDGEWHLKPEKKKNFELIEEIVVGKGGTTLIERTHDMNGVEYSFEEVYIRLEIEASDFTGTATFASVANGGSSCGIGSLIANVKKFSSLQYQIRGGILFTSFQTASTDKTWASAKQLDGDIMFTDKIYSLKFSCNATIPEGSKITIYAIRN